MILARHCQVSVCRAGLGPNRRQNPGDSGTRHLRPSQEGAGAQYPVVGWAQQMPSDAEEIQDNRMNRQEPLRLSDRLEASHLSLSLSGRLVRDLSPIVGVLSSVVGHGRHQPAMRCCVAAQLVGNETPGLASLCGQQPVEEALSGQPIPTRLDEDVDRVAVLVDCPQR